MKRFGIYIHIPFCKKKCKYCDFTSFTCEDKIEQYFKSLIFEIKNKNIDFGLHQKEISTIYFGGGTPSLPDYKYIEKVLDVIKQEFKLKRETEITIEINPGTVDEEKLVNYKRIGINRISIGLQSTHDRILELIGRVHNYDEFLNTYNLVKKVGYNNINVDLMLAIPTQTENELIESVNKIIELNPNHISLYSLILEDGTELEKLVNEKKIQLVDDEIERKMYWTTKNILENNGYNHYEISNFAQKGYESKHNLDCWNQEEYVGFGLAAHSYIDGKRFSNTEILNEYINNTNKIKVNEEQTLETMAKEYMMIGLRKIEGISISKFEQKFKFNPLYYFRFEIDKLVKMDLIEVDLDKIRLTNKGIDFANLVFEKFV